MQIVLWAEHAPSLDTVVLEERLSWDPTLMLEAVSITIGGRDEPSEPRAETGADATITIDVPPSAWPSEATELRALQEHLVAALGETSHAANYLSGAWHGGASVSAAEARLSDCADGCCDWCAASVHPWIEKCAWRGACAACRDGACRNAGMAHKSAAYGGAAVDAEASLALSSAAAPALASMAEPTTSAGCFTGGEPACFAVAIKASRVAHMATASDASRVEQKATREA